MPQPIRYHCQTYITLQGHIQLDSAFAQHKQTGSTEMSIQATSVTKKCHSCSTAKNAPNQYQGKISY